LRGLRLGALRADYLGLGAAIFQFSRQMGLQSGGSLPEVAWKTRKNQKISKKYLPKISHKGYNE
jgi:hypothetical protein